MRNFTILFFCFCSCFISSQELNCDVVVNANQTGNENLQVFQTLERQVQEFINNTSWTNKTVSPHERINCNMIITIDTYSGNNFSGTLQIGSSRPVFNSTYSTPIYNFNDKDFSFRYQEFQNFNFSPLQFESNLVSVLAFHVYIMLGIDADSFKLNGGKSYYEQARAILNYSQQSNNYKGWRSEDGLRSRFTLIDNLQSTTYIEFKNVMYNYHINGLDIMHQNPKDAKENISDTLGLLEIMNGRRPNSFILRVFFDAKANEVEQIFSDGPSVNIKDLNSTLTRIAPSHATKWRNIKF